MRSNLDLVLERLSVDRAAAQHDALAGHRAEGRNHAAGPAAGAPRPRRPRA
jgi:hypothetical protein